MFVGLLFYLDQGPLRATTREENLAARNMVLLLLWIQLQCSL